MRCVPRLGAIFLSLSTIPFALGCAGVAGSKASSTPPVAGPPVISMSTGSVNFGSVTIGSTASQSVTVSNVGGSSLTVTQAVVVGSEFSVASASFPIVVGADQHNTINVQFSPKAGGPASGTLSVLSDASNSSANVSLSGTGMQNVAHSVTLSWNSSASPVIGYNVYRSLISGGPYSRLDSQLVPTDSYTDTTVQAGLTYYYVVTSVDSAGLESSDSAQASAAVP